jgi:DNA-binding NarL/FixJ family response regulator
MNNHDPALALEAFRAGAAAYLIKHAATEELPRAIREVVNGRTYLTSQISGRLPDC